MSDKELEEIVSNSQLFDSVLAEIDSINEEKTKRSLFDWNWLKVSFVNRKAVIGAFAVLFFFMIFTGLILNGRQDSTKSAENRVQTDFLKAKNSLSTVEVKNKSYKDSFDKEKEEIAAKNEVVKKQKTSNIKNTKSTRNLRKTNAIKRQKNTIKSKEIKETKGKKNKFFKEIKKESRTKTILFIAF